jgi:hypothetical protein
MKALRRSELRSTKKTLERRTVRRQYSDDLLKTNQRPHEVGYPNQTRHVFVRTSDLNAQR